MNDAYLTLAGNVVDEPRLRRTKSGHMVANFRLASTARRKDPESGSWEDVSTLFVTVTCWRGLAKNVHASLHKGHPVVVTGRYFAREYQVEEAVRVSYEVEATAVGHDLSRGVSEFQRAGRAADRPTVEVGDDGVPVDASDAWLDAEPPAGSPERQPTQPGSQLAVAG